MNHHWDEGQNARTLSRLDKTVLLDFLRHPALAPEILEPVRRKFGVAHRVLDILVPEVSLQSPRSTIGQCLKDQYDAVTTPMPAHLAALVEPLEMQE